MRHHHVCLAELKKTTKNFVKVADLPAKKNFKTGIKEQQVHNKFYCKLGEKATGTFKMIKVASGEHKMGKAYFLKVLQVQKQCDLCEDTECLKHPSMSNRD
jgi:hypothetical protein